MLFAGVFAAQVKALLRAHHTLKAQHGKPIAALDPKPPMSRTRSMPAVSATPNSSQSPARSAAQQPVTGAVSPGGPVECKGCLPSITRSLTSNSRRGSASSEPTTNSPGRAPWTAATPAASRFVQIPAHKTAIPCTCPLAAGAGAAPSTPMSRQASAAADLGASPHSKVILPHLGDLPDDLIIEVRCCLMNALCWIWSSCCLVVEAACV